MIYSLCKNLFPCVSVPGHVLQDPSAAAFALSRWFHLQYYLCLPLSPLCTTGTPPEPRYGFPATSSARSLHRHSLGYPSQRVLGATCKYANIPQPHTHLQSPSSTILVSNHNLLCLKTAYQRSHFTPLSTGVSHICLHIILVLLCKKKSGQEVNQLLSLFLGLPFIRTLWVHDKRLTMKSEKVI